MDVRWIPIGWGKERDELERIIRTLKDRWNGRYDYRIEEGDHAKDASQPCPYRLFVRHV